MGAVIVCCSTVEKPELDPDNTSPRESPTLTEKLVAGLPAFVREASGVTRLPTH